MKQSVSLLWTCASSSSRGSKTYNKRLKQKRRANSSLGAWNPAHTHAYRSKMLQIGCTCGLQGLNVCVVWPRLCCFFLKVQIWDSTISFGQISQSCLSRIKVNHRPSWAMGKKPQRSQRVKCPLVIPKESQTQRIRVLGADISGVDDAGREYPNLSELWLVQGQQRDKFYRVNENWWVEGYEGRTTLEGAMIGDDGSEEDLTHSCTLLARAIETMPQKPHSALDIGAGVGRVTKGVLLPVVTGPVTLVDQSAKWLRAAKTYLAQDASRCFFVQSKLEDYQPPSDRFDLIWIQWTLQYLIDQDVVELLKRLSACLSSHGVLVLKENRPVYSQRDCFQMDTPGKEGRFDITRPEKHLAVLVELSGLTVVHMENWDECSCWLLSQEAKAEIQPG